MPGKQSKMLVLGGSGFVGRVLVSRFKCPGTSFSGKEGYLRCDATDFLSLAHVLEETNPDVVVNCVGLANVDLAETNPELARKLNLLSVRNIVEMQKKLHFKLVHISTDYVFDGEEGHRAETDKENPINAYGKTKLEGEHEISDKEDSLILRISTPYGDGKGSVKKQFFEHIVENVSKGNTVKAVSDQIVTPTYLPDLARAMKTLLDNERTGVFHISSLDTLSRFEFAQEVARAAGLNEELVEPVPMRSLEGWIAKRPRDTSLDVSLSMKSGVKYTRIRDALGELMSRKKM